MHITHKMSIKQDYMKTLDWMHMDNCMNMNEYVCLISCYVTCKTDINLAHIIWIFWICIRIVCECLCHSPPSLEKLEVCWFPSDLDLCGNTKMENIHITLKFKCTLRKITSEMLEISADWRIDMCNYLVSCMILKICKILKHYKWEQRWPSG